MRAGRGARVGTKAGRIVRIVRILRLVRIMKLYKHSQAALNKNEDGKDVNKKASDNPRKSAPIGANKV